MQEITIEYLINHEFEKTGLEEEKSSTKPRTSGMFSASDLYVSNFKNNYAQMKLDGPKTYGKVFEDDGENVWIWKEVEQVLRKYKDSFLE